MNKTEIRVAIDSKEKQKRAIEILNKHGEKIWDEKAIIYFGKDSSLIFNIYD